MTHVAILNIYICLSKKRKNRNMKKFLMGMVLVLSVAMIVSSCASSQRYKGCPTTNKRYFTG